MRLNDLKESHRRECIKNIQIEIHHLCEMIVSAESDINESLDLKDVSVREIINMLKHEHRIEKQVHLLRQLQSIWNVGGTNASKAIRNVGSTFDDMSRLTSKGLDL